MKKVRKAKSATDEHWAWGEAQKAVESLGQLEGLTRTDILRMAKLLCLKGIRRGRAQKPKKRQQRMRMGMRRMRLGPSEPCS